MDYRTSNFAIVQALAVVALAVAVPPPATAQGTDVKEAWLKRNCMDKGNADLPISQWEFVDCVRKQAELLPPLDKNRRELFGQEYDPQKWVECRARPGNRNNSACDVYILRRREWPEFWPTGAKRIKWPDAPKESVYRKGMSPQQYWEALCKAEAGEFIYRTVKDVEGFLLVRPRGAETEYAIADRYVLEDAYGLLEFGYQNREKRPGELIFERSAVNYLFVEGGLVSNLSGAVRIRHQIDSQKLVELLRTKKSEMWGEKDFSKIVEVSEFASRFGLIWRGIRRNRDIEMSVSGGELAILDMRTGEIVALRRGFALGRSSRLLWLGSWGCPIMARDFASLSSFVRKVLQPKGL